MDLVQLRYFLKVVECCNFTHAASACNISQPALSQQISKLEKELGSSLFDRQGRRAQLTPVGHILKESAERILLLVDETKRRLDDSGQVGRIHLGADTTIGPFFATRLLQWLEAEMPKAEFCLSEFSDDNVWSRLEKAEIDLALVPQPQYRNAEIQYKPILQEEIHIVLPSDHPLTKKSSLEPADLNGQKLILMDDRRSFTRHVLDFLDRCCVSFEVVGRVEQFLSIQHLVMLGKGISFMPQMAIPRQVRRGMTIRRWAGEPLQRTITMAWRKDRYQTQLLSHLTDAITHFSQFKFVKDRQRADEAVLAVAETPSRGEPSMVDEDQEIVTAQRRKSTKSAGATPKSADLSKSLAANGRISLAEQDGDVGES